MKGLGQTIFWASMFIEMDWSAWYDWAKVHRWSIEVSQYRNDKKGFLPHGKELSNIKCFDTSWAKTEIEISKICVPWYVHCQISPML